MMKLLKLGLAETFWILYLIISINLIDASTARKISPFREPDDTKCSDNDSCDGGLLRTCTCDSNCHLYGTCCWDAEKFPLMKDEPQTFICYSERILNPIFVKKSCPKDYSGDPFLKSSCENPSNSIRDLMNSVLVSSFKTKTTYLNWNCAMCNNEKAGNLNFWTIEFSCLMTEYKTPDEIRKNIAYSSETNEWGIRLGQQLCNCSLNYHNIQLLSSQMERCASHVVSACPEEWEDNDIRNKCDSYYGERKLRDADIYFKNVHCALCNGRTLQELECYSRIYTPQFPEIGFNIVKVAFNLNKEDGKRCSRTHRYDPFFKICRNVAKGLRNPDDDIAETNTAVSQSIYYFLILISLYVTRKHIGL